MRNNLFKPLLFILFVFIQLESEVKAMTAMENLSVFSATNYVAEVDSALLRMAEEEDKKATEAMKVTDYREAIAHMEKALPLYKEVQDSVMMAVMYRDIADCMTNINAEAQDIVQYYRNACTILNEIGAGTEEIKCLIKIRKFYLLVGKNEEYAEISNEIDKKISEMPPTPKLYSLLGDEQFNDQNYAGAIPYYEKAKVLFEETGFEKDSIPYSILCSNLMVSYYFSKRYDEAINVGDLLISFDQKNGIRPTSLYSILLIRLYCYLRQEKIDQAFECVDIATRKLGNHPSAFARNIPYVLANDVCNATGDYVRMLEYASMSDSILAVEFKETDDERLNVLDRRIVALSQLDRHQEAVALSRHKMQIKKSIHQNNPDVYLADLLQLANMEAFSGFYQNPQDKDSAKIHMAEYARIEEEGIRTQAPWLTTMQRNALWRKTQRTLLQITGFATQLGAVQEPFVEEVYNAHLLASGLLLQTEKAMTDAILQRGSAEDKLAITQLLALRDSIAEAERYRNVTKQAKLQMQIQTIENSLLKNSAASLDYTAYLNTNFKDIHSSLTKGEVIVDFLEVQHVENNDNSLTAFILRPEWESPHLMRVCRYSEINNISESLNAKLYEDSISNAFRHLVLDSVLNYVKPGESLYYVPDGILHGVALENLKMDDGRMLSDIYAMRRLSSAREIAKLHFQQERAYQDAVLYGSLDYGTYKSSVEAIPVSTENAENAERGVGDAYEALRATEYEIKTIESILKKSRVKTFSYRKNNGTEESFRALDGVSPDIIHLATHGYYLTQEQAQKVKGLAGYTDAMDLSGLVMSGGNAGWLKEPTENGSLDGLLSAQDIAGLDLSNTKLVVLSACKTAVGQTLTDGIFGLQRAFKKAGAGSLIMTLWGVNDQVTALFMTAFYQELTKNKWNKYKAFDDAKKQIKAQYPEPYYWAGFIMLD